MAGGFGGREGYLSTLTARHYTLQPATPSQTRKKFYADHVVRLDLGLRVIAADSPSDFSGDSDFGSTPILYQPPSCPPQLAVMNKNGALYIYNRNAIGSGPMQALQISGAPGAFIGDPVYDPVLNQVYTGNDADDGSGSFRTEL
jgi:hypothetical protein